MSTGNLADWREDGKLVIRVYPADEHVPFATASFKGWYYEHAVGQGSTVAAAIADLRDQTGITEDARIEEG